MKEEVLFPQSEDEDLAAIDFEALQRIPGGLRILETLLSDKVTIHQTPDGNWMIIPEEEI